jgi:hypothetical protein
MFDFLSGFMPRKLKDLFRWCEYLYYNSTHIYAAGKKLADYVITDLAFETDNDAAKQKYMDLAEQPNIRLKGLLKIAALDKLVYGNGFYSVYFPVSRMATCPKCKTATSLKVVTFKYDAKKKRFTIPCPGCDQKYSRTLDQVSDKSIARADNATIIRWDPKLIDIDYNPITGERQYYHNVPGYVRKKVENSDNLFIASMPKSFLKAIADDYVIKLDSENLFHLKVDAPSGIDPQWGFPPLAATLKKFYYAAVLRKANEAIALDYVVPFRVLHPAPSSGSGDPVQMISMSNWVSNTRNEIRRWRKDPLHIMMSPVALAVSQMGGQGRALMTLQEVQQVEDDIIASMGIPREFLYGGMTFTGSSVTLRMLENQLLNDAAQLNELANWVLNRCGQKLRWAPIKVKLTPFKFIDDVQQKNLELQANAQYNYLSTTSIAQMFSRDLQKERKQQLEETLDQLKHEATLNQKSNELQNSLAAQAQAAQMDTMGGGGMTYDQQAVIGNADMIVDDLMNMEHGQRKSMLSSLQAEDYVLYSVVIQRLEEAQLQMKNEAAAQYGVDAPA